MSSKQKLPGPSPPKVGERSTHRPSLLGCVVKMASDEDRLTRDQQVMVMLPFCLEHEILFQMRPDPGEQGSGWRCPFSSGSRADKGWAVKRARSSKKV